MSLLPGFLRTRIITHVYGYSYLLTKLYQTLKAVETATDLSPRLKPGACVSFSGQSTAIGRKNLRKRTTVEHSLAHVGHWQGNRARYRATAEKSLRSTPSRCCP